MLITVATNSEIVIENTACAHKQKEKGVPCLKDLALDQLLSWEIPVR